MTVASHRVNNGPRRWWELPAGCSAVSTGSFGIVCASAGTVREVAGLSLLLALACAIWLAYRARFRAIVPAIGLTLAFLVLAGLALAGARMLTTVPTALVIWIATLTAAWASVRSPGPFCSPGSVRAPGPVRSPGPVRARALPGKAVLAVAGAGFFAVASVFAVHYAADSATASADGVSSLAIWAYPAGDRLQVGLQAPAGQEAVSLRVLVTQAGTRVAAWNIVRIAPGKTWEAPALTLTGNGSVQVTALHGGTVVASLPASPG
ncbi:MAG: hypothetical protein ACRDN0_09080 [Trebonia sp.]